MTTDLTAILGVRAGEKSGIDVALIIHDPTSLMILPGAFENRIDFGKAYITRHSDEVVVRARGAEEKDLMDFFVLTGHFMRQQVRHAIADGLVPYEIEVNTAMPVLLPHQTLDRMTTLLYMNNRRR